MSTGIESTIDDSRGATIRRGATAVLRAIVNGADPRAVGDALRQAGLGTAVGDLVAAVADERDHQVADNHPLWEAAINLRDADRLIDS